MSCTKNKALTGASAGALRFLFPVLFGGGSDPGAEKVKNAPPLRARSESVTSGCVQRLAWRVVASSASISFVIIARASWHVPQCFVRETINRRTLRKPHLLSGSCACWARARVHCEHGPLNSSSSVSGRAAVKSDPA